MALTFCPGRSRPRRRPWGMLMCGAQVGKQGQAVQCGYWAASCGGTGVFIALVSLLPCADAICRGAYPWDSTATCSNSVACSSAMPGIPTVDQLITRLRLHTGELYRSSEELQLLAAERERCLAYLQARHEAINAARGHVAHRKAALAGEEAVPACSSFAARQPSNGAERMREAWYCDGLLLLLDERLEGTTAQLSAARQAFTDGAWAEAQGDLYEAVDEEDAAM